MKKVAAFMNYKNDDLKDIATFMHQESQKISKAYDDVLKLSIEQYIGRDFDPIGDSKRIYLNCYDGTNQTDIYIDNKLIGSIVTNSGHTNDDFIKNKLSFTITFTPNKKHETTI